MDLIFEKNLNDNINPIIRENLKEIDIVNFIQYIKDTKNKEFINYLKRIIENSPEIGQILLDIHDIYKIDGIIECLILNYLKNQ